MRRTNKEIIEEMESKYSKFAEFAVKTFILCNGVINPTFRATNITFGPKDIMRTGTVLGQQVFSRIDINLFNIFTHCLRMKAIRDDQVNAVIMNTVIHELSHCDQYIDYLNPSKKYMMAIENINRDWVIQFIVNNREVLKRELVEVDFDTAIKCSTPIAHKPDWPESVYRSVLSPGMKIEMCLNKIVNDDLSGLFRSCKNIDLEYNTSLGQRYTCPMTRNGKWQDIYLITTTLQRAVDECSNYMYMVKSSDRESDPVTVVISSIIDKPRMVLA